MQPTDPYAVTVMLYGPHSSGGGFEQIGEGRFTIDLAEEFTTESCADLLGQFIRQEASKYEWQGLKPIDLVAGGMFPPLEFEWVYADISGRELIEK
jgi:hypothetical protein